jgi:hypothetical protein
MKSLISLCILLSFVSCQLKTSHETPDTTTKENSTLVDPKYSLSKDRSEFNKLREAIPPDIKKSNDEKALFAEWFSEVKMEPDKIRDKFDALVHKKRDAFNKDQTKAREAYNKDERAKRAELLKNLEQERKDFLAKKPDKDKRTEMFNDQDEKRRTQFAEQKEKREDFEGDMREKRKDFEDYIREKTNDFNSELKAYRVKWNEKEKEKTPQYP